KSAIDAIKSDADLAADDLATAKTTAGGQLDSYVDPADYTINGTALTAAITTGKANIDAATDEAGVASALAAAKSAIDVIKSDADLAAENLATAEVSLNDNGQPITSLSDGQIWINLYVKLTGDEFIGQPLERSMIIFDGDFAGLSLNGTRWPENEITAILDGVHGTITNNSGKGTITIKGSALQSGKDLTITIDVISSP
ncbi:hypothetical protein, partial [Paenibacillus silvae]|uniref:hypothetical protein n=1 Tax=Paenibacillus silvae TaxID=1325358 RepID=UPI00166DCA34